MTKVLDDPIFLNMFISDFLWPVYRGIQEKNQLSLALHLNCYYKSYKHNIILSLVFSGTILDQVTEGALWESWKN